MQWSGKAAQARSAAGDAYGEVAPWVEPLARLGYAAKGLVYILVGGLALIAAIGRGGGTTGSRGALSSISDSSAGRIILAIIALGLLGYVIWSFVRATRNPENDSGAKRAFHGLVAVIYASLAVEATRLALSGRSGGSGDDSSGPVHWSARLMEQPFGQWLLGAAGVAVAVYGVQQLISAWKIDLDDQLALGSMSSSARTWTVRTSRFGLAARGVVFTIIGAFVVIAAVQADPSEARGIDGVLDTMAGTPLLLGTVALGLAAYGVYNLVRARYRFINPGR